MLNTQRRIERMWRLGRWNLILMTPDTAGRRWLLSEISWSRSLWTSAGVDNSQGRFCAIYHLPTAISATLSPNSPIRLGCKSMRCSEKYRGCLPPPGVSVSLSMNSMGISMSLIRLICCLTCLRVWIPVDLRFRMAVLDGMLTTTSDSDRVEALVGTEGLMSSRPAIVAILVASVGRHVKEASLCDDLVTLRLRLNRW